MSRFKHNLTYFLVFLSIALSLIFFHKLNWLKTIENAFFKITSPVSGLFYNFNSSISNFAETVNSIKEIKKQGRKLLEENNALKMKNAKLKEELLNFQTMEEIDQFEKQQKDKTLLVNITGGSETMILIDKGYKEGIKNGLAIVTAQGFLIGHIEEIFKDYSKVLLITSQNSLINVQFQETRTLALLEGNYHLGAVINNLPAGEKIELDENVITSGRDENIPRGILIGRIKEINTSPDSIFKQAGVELEADFNKLEKLFVVMN